MLSSMSGAACWEPWDDVGTIAEASLRPLTVEYLVSVAAAGEGPRTRQHASDRDFWVRWVDGHSLRELRLAAGLASSMTAEVARSRVDVTLTADHHAVL